MGSHPGAGYIPWRTFTLTHVDYPDGDLFAKVMAILSLTPLVIVIIHLTVFACKRDLHTLFYGIGTIGNGILNYVLKQIFKEPRPDKGIHVRDSTKLFEEYGMPSSHSQFMFFVSVYMTLFVWFRLKHQGCFWKVVWCMLCLGLAATVAYGRIYLHYHTWAQVLVGSSIGGGVALVWFLFVHCALTPYFAWIASWGVCEYLLIRDLTAIPNVIWFEYTSSKAEGRARNRKMSLKSKQS